MEMHNILRIWLKFSFVSKFVNQTNDLNSPGALSCHGISRLLLDTSGNQKGLGLKRTHRFLFCSDGINLLSKNTDTIKNRRVLLCTAVNFLLSSLYGKLSVPVVWLEWLHERKPLQEPDI
jgi:hypothetical protein